MFLAAQFVGTFTSALCMSHDLSSRHVSNFSCGSLERFAYCTGFIYFFIYFLYMSLLICLILHRCIVHCVRRKESRKMLLYDNL